MIRVAVDGQTFASPDADRGIGVYLRHLLRHLPEVPECRFELARWGPAPEGIPPAEDLPTFRLSDAGPSGDTEGGPALTRAQMRNWALRRFVREHGSAVVFNPNPLQPGVEAVVRAGNVPLVATVHDLTPLVLPEIFLGPPHQTFEEFYRQRLAHLLEHADALIADSEATRQDLIARLGVSPERVTVVHCGVDPIFRPDAPPEEDFRYLMSLPQTTEGEVPVTPGGYLLSVGGYNPKKNFERLFEALGKLEQAISDMPLVLAGPLDDGDWRRLTSLRDRHAPRLKLRRAGYVGDAGLAALYRHAALLAFPSLHEGFGLPVLEAMACGCPVVGGEAGAVPEVAAGSVRLCDPASADSIGQALEEVLSSSALREKLRAAGAARARSFSWRKAAFQTAEVLLRTAERRITSFGTSQTVAATLTEPGRKRLLWYSPLPPDPGGVSAYSASLLHELEDRYEIVLVRDPALPPPEGLDAFAQVAPAEAHSAAADLRVYHMGNNLAQCAFTYDALRRNPGVVLVHDLNIHGFLLEHLVRSRPNGGWLGGGTLQEHPYYLALAEAHGEAGGEQARRVLEDAGFPDIAHYPAHRLLSRSSLALVTHSRWGRDRLEANGDPAPVFTLPLGIEHPLTAPAGAGKRLREEIGAAADELVLACAGFLEPNRRLDSVLLALEELKRRGVAARLLLAGGVDPAMRRWLEEIAAERGLLDRVVWRGYLPRDEDFLATIDAADVVVHLRHPTNGESSATILRALSMGRPVIVSAADAYRELPDDCCWKVDADRTEIPLLAEYLEALAVRPEIRLAMSAAGRRHIALHHAWPEAAARFRRILETVLASTTRR